MINKIYFPSGNGLVLKSVITENEDGSVKIKIDKFSINGETASSISRAKTFTMKIGDIVYITPNGLVQSTHDEDGKEIDYPDESNRFSNGSIYWVLNKLDDTTYNNLETEEE